MMLKDCFPKKIRDKLSARRFCSNQISKAPRGGSPGKVENTSCITVYIDVVKRINNARERRRCILYHRVRVLAHRHGWMQEKRQIFVLRGEREREFTLEINETKQEEAKMRRCNLYKEREKKCNVAIVYARKKVQFTKEYQRNLTSFQEMSFQKKLIDAEFRR